jgi:hypothetical protein
MNVISFSFFRDCPEWLFPFYLKGVEYNIRMAKILFPGWEVVTHTNSRVWMEYGEYLNGKGSMIIQHSDDSRCQSMLWRLKPLYMEGVERVICRDLDAVLTYRDFKSVERWIASGKIAHGMNDNQAHGGMPLMGGMCGFKAREFKELFPSWEELVQGDLSQHGSDQSLLMQKVYPKVKDSIYFDQFPEHYPYEGLAESDLTCKHIGSAGVITMELERFLHKYEK